MHTAEQLAQLRQEKKDLLTHLRAHWSLAQPDEHFFGAKAEQKLHLRCPVHGDVSIGVSPALEHWRHRRDTVDEQLCVRCGYAFRGKQHAAKRAEGLKNHHEQQRAAGHVPESLRTWLETVTASGRWSFDLSTYTAMGKPWSGLCAEHGRFETPRAQQFLRRTQPCPSCQAQVNASLGEAGEMVRYLAQYRREGKLYVVKSPFAGVGAGWLYRIVDKGSSRCYFGITHNCVEERFAGHREAAARGKRQPLYEAMRTRPQDFSVHAVAFFKDAASLAEAERQHIAEHGTRWPDGYNRSAGGELRSLRSDTSVRNLLKGPLTERERELVLNFRECLAGIGISREAWRVRLQQGMSIEDSLTLVAQPPQPVVVEGCRYDSADEACRALGLNVNTFRGRKARTQASAEAALAAQLDVQRAHGQALTTPGLVRARFEDVLKDFVIGEQAVLAHMADHGCTAVQAAETLAARKGVFVRGTLHGSLAKACRHWHVSASEVSSRRAAQGLDASQALEQLLQEKEANPFREAHFKTTSAEDGRFEFRGQCYRSPGDAAQAFGLSRKKFNAALTRRGLTQRSEAAANVLAELVDALGQEPRFVVDGAGFPSLAQACKAAGVSVGTVAWYRKSRGVSEQAGLDLAREAARQPSPTDPRRIAAVHLGVDWEDSERAADIQALASSIQEALDAGHSVFQVRKRLQDGVSLQAPRGAWAPAKRAAVVPASAKSVVVDGRAFSGYQQACRHYGVQPKRVQRVAEKEGFDLAESILWCRDNPSKFGRRHQAGTRPGL